MTTNINITQTWWRLLSAVGSTLITLVAWLGYMALCMVGEVILGIVKFIFGIIISILSMVVLIGTFIWLFASQQCRYYEVDNIFEYMVDTYINGNITSFKDIYRELNKDARRDFVDFIFNEVNPKYTIELIKQTI